ncbi:ABC transporter permease [Pseudaminobacter soli (ex Li et al. 2025)]|uniref:Peptide ABC transporter permease n=1 Tax=Pseudaminobacter soli (ex Li et al. 2025) TaxID=1295366 RepID=A0A2P7S1Z5_9HYPH|nr:ABC transporter permease [Mesorhizobium soli]PSJ56479.1 peptide ABC transporter permease [Mesorhizobium soli]
MSVDSPNDSAVIGVLAWAWPLLGRLMQGVLTLLAVSLLIFLAARALPGDVANMILGQSATQDQLAALRTQLGLDQPLWWQYLTWLGGILHGDWGVSLANGQPVAEILTLGVRNSATLSGVALAVMLPLSLLVGVIAAQFRDGFVDRLFLGMSMVANAVPDFVTGTVLVALFATTVLHVLPAVSFIPPGDSPFSYPDALVLPAITVIIPGVMYLARLVRVAVIDVMATEYIQTAILKGMSPSRILFRHALPNAVAPIIPAASLVAAFTVGGVVVVEYLFAYPGIGSALVDAVTNRDLPVIQANVLVIASAYFILNLIADALAQRDDASTQQGRSQA